MRILSVLTLLTLLPCVCGLWLLPPDAFVFCVADDGCAQFAPTEHQHRHVHGAAHGAAHDHGGCACHHHGADHDHHADEHRSGVRLDPRSCRDVPLNALAPSIAPADDVANLSSSALARLAAPLHADRDASIAQRNATYGPPRTGPPGDPPAASGDTITCIETVVLLT